MWPYALPFRCCVIFHRVPIPPCIHSVVNAILGCLQFGAVVNKWLLTFYSCLTGCYMNPLYSCRPIAHLLHKASRGRLNPWEHSVWCAPGVLGPTICLSARTLWEDGRGNPASFLDDISISLKVRYVRALWWDSPLPGIYSTEKLPECFKMRGRECSMQC